jgi:GNAT superfamily N-acetyltransferase
VVKMPRELTVSFGVEYEFDFINSDNHTVTDVNRHRGTVLDGWDISGDITTTTEICTRPFTNLEDAFESTQRNFDEYLAAYDNLAPYMCARPNRSIGQHQHLGRPRNRLLPETRAKIARKIVKVYPFLGALHASAIPSPRGLSSQYCFSVAHIRGFDPLTPISSDHFCEISASLHGTVECRLFDANLPQVSYTCSLILTALARKAIQDNNETPEPLNPTWYNNERNRALTNGINALDLVDYLRQIRNQVGNLEIPNIPCIKEILYVACKFGFNPAQVKSYSQISTYNYFKANISNVKEYLGNMIPHVNNEKRIQLQRWKDEASVIDSLDMLIGVAQASRERIAQAIAKTQTESPTRPIMITPRIPRSHARELINSSDYYILRINQVPSRTPESVAQELATFIHANGEGYVNELDAERIIEDPRRFYVFAIGSRYDIVGTIAVNVSGKEISCLVVDRRYRRLGIAQRLISHVLCMQELRNASRLHCYIRRENTASQQLFTRMGFVPSGAEDGRSLEYILERRS